MDHHKFGASSLDALELCPGKANLEESMPESKNKYSESGNRCHSTMETNDVIDLTEKEIDYVAIAKEKEVEYLEEIKETHKIKELLIEQKLNLFYGYELLNFGTADKIILTENKAFSIDWKFGFEIFSIYSRQFQSYAIAIMQLYDVEEVDIFLCQPTREFYKRITYTRTELLEKLEEIKIIIDKAKKEDAGCIAGEKQCNYCKAKLNCHAYMRKFKPAEYQKNNIAEVDDSELSSLYDDYLIINKIGKKLKAEIEKRIKNNGSCGKYSIKKLKGNKELKDIKKVFKKLSGYIDESELLSCAKFSLTDIKTLVAPKIKAEAEKMTKKESEELFLNLISEEITHGKNKESLKRG
jgi:hypothetical protein